MKESKRKKEKSKKHVKERQRRTERYCEEERDSREKRKKITFGEIESQPERELKRSIETINKIVDAHSQPKTLSSNRSRYRSRSRSNSLHRHSPVRHKRGRSRHRQAYRSPLRRKYYRYSTDWQLSDQRFRSFSLVDEGSRRSRRTTIDRRNRLRRRSSSRSTSRERIRGIFKSDANDDRPSKFRSRSNNRNRLRSNSPMDRLARRNSPNKVQKQSLGHATCSQETRNLHSFVNTSHSSAMVAAYAEIAARKKRRLHRRQESPT